MKKLITNFFIEYYKQKYNKVLKSVNRRNGILFQKKTTCPKCAAPHQYIYNNNGNKGKFKSTVCDEKFNVNNYSTKPIIFICPYCGHTLAPKKDRKEFKVHKYTSLKC